MLKDLKLVLDVLDYLGFVVNFGKSVLDPCQQLEYLGLLIDSNLLSLSLPPGKVDAISKLCLDSLGSGKSWRVSLRDLAKIMGNFSWAIPAVPFAQGHFRKLQAFYISYSHGDLDKLVSLTPDARDDLLWWASHLRFVNGKTFFPANPDLGFFSDASLFGWGAVCDGIRSRGPWPLADKIRHINEVELMGALFALQIYIASSSYISVNIFLDNTTAVAYINKCGGTRSPPLSEIAAQIVSWCESRHICIFAAHLPGNSNIVTDEESRTSLDPSDWMLWSDDFRKLASIWHVHTDLFASAWNAQLPRFVSWLPQPQDLAVNAFALNWSNLEGYAFPPFSLIPRCLDKIRRDQADVVLVCPLWQSQAWFPLLLQITAPPVVGEEIPAERLEVIRKRFQSRGFSSGVVKLFMGMFDGPRSRPINPHGSDGWIGVLNEIWIPYRLL